MVSAAMGLMKLHGHDRETQLKVRRGSGGNVASAEYILQLADMMPD